MCNYVRLTQYLDRYHNLKRSLIYRFCPCETSYFVPKRPYDVSRGQNRYVRLPLCLYFVLFVSTICLGRKRRRAIVAGGKKHRRNAMIFHKAKSRLSGPAPLPCNCKMNISLQLIQLAFLTKV